VYQAGCSFAALLTTVLLQAVRQILDLNLPKVIIMITLVRSTNHVCTVALTFSLLILGGCKKDDAVAPGGSPQSFRVIQTTPANGDVNVSTGSDVYVHFSEPIDTGSVRSSFSIAPGVSGTFLLYPDTSYCIFQPLQVLRAGATHTVVIAPTLRARNGETLGTEYRFSFTTVPFKVIQTHPDSGETDVSRSVTIQIRFNGNLDTTSIPRAFTVSPYIPGLLTAYSGNTSFYFYSSTLYLPRTTYIVRVSTAIRTLTGDSLATPYVFPFTTGMY
jgi:hypothetical protein